MRVSVNGVIYDSTVTPIVIEFDVNEQKLFNDMKKFVSAPADYTEEQREYLMSKPLEKLEKEYHRNKLKMQLLKMKVYPKLDIVDREKEIDYWKQLFYNEYEARERAIDELHTRRIKELFEMAETIDDIRKSYNKYKEVLERIESWTKNPKAYEPSLYTINHICRDVLGLNEEKRISVNNLTSGTPQVFPDNKKNQLYKYFLDGSIDDIKWKELKDFKNE